MSDDLCIHDLAPGTCTICLHGPTPRGPELRESECRSCGAGVIWGINPKTGKRNPLDAEPVPGRGNISLDGFDDEGTPVLVYGAKGSGCYVSHFSTCPNERP